MDPLAPRGGPDYRRGMFVCVALALWLALPVPAEPGGAPPLAPAIEAWLAGQRAAGRVLDPLGAKASGEGAQAAFVDRSGGCVRGWVRVRIASVGGAATPEIAEVLGAACDQPAGPLNHLLHFVTAIARKDWVGVGEHLPPGGLFPVAREAPGKPMKRTTHDRDQVLAGKVELPGCDVLEDTPACDEPRPSGRVTCRCEGPSGMLEIDFMLPRPGPPQPAELMSVRHRRAK